MEITAIFDHLLTAEAIANNVDLLTEILLRVPAKSLVRFKCVSKDWLSFISDSKFSNNHMLKNLNTSISGLYIDSRPLFNFNKKSGDGLPKLDFLNTSSQVKTTILHSCNGLILCSRGQEIIVCNLTTQKFTVLPSPPKPSARISDADKFLVVNPIRLPHYKVVLIDIKDTSLDSIGIFSSFYSYDIDIFSSENGIWNSKHFSEPRFDPLTRKVLCDGAIYWIADGNNLVFFDTDKDDLSANQMPPEPVIFGYHFVSWFGEHAGYLLLTQTIKNNGTQLRVLEMDMHNYSWMTKYNVNLEPIKDTFYRNDIAGYCEDSKFWWKVGSFARINNKSADVLCFKGEDGKETLALLLAISGKIISYDLDSNYWEVLQIRDLPREFHEPLFFKGTLGNGVHKFTESLATIT